MPVGLHAAGALADGLIVQQLHAGDVIRYLQVVAVRPLTRSEAHLVVDLVPARNQSLSATAPLFKHCSASCLTWLHQASAPSQGNAALTIWILNTRS